MTHEFPPDLKRGVYEAIVRRRDMRQFLPDPIADDVLARILMAAHHAGSVGFMQPWNFIVVRDLATRKKVHAHVDAERIKAAEGFAGQRREKYLSLKLEGILDAPINLCVTCDPTRHGPTVLGRNTMKETDLYSTCCAIQNLWLAARAEGIGVGWVSILQPEQLRQLLDIPEHVIPLAYLCVGHVEKFGDRPLLEAADWLPRLSLSDLVYCDRWGNDPSDTLKEQLDKGIGTDW